MRSVQWLRKLSPIARVLLGLALGILTGLFFGEPVGALSLVGDAYIRLLQMTVLPYILVSLAVGLGGLNAAMARRIGLGGGSMILVLWGVTLATLLCLPLAYPDWTSATFFSSSLVAEPAPFDPLGLYIPANPFYSLGHTVVPAVVLFAIALGLALISVEEKQGLLNGLHNLSKALMKIASFVGKIAPIGIFAIAASAAGTLRVEELSRLQVFLWVYLAAWSVLAFWTLPVLVAWASPFSYRQVIREAQVAMVTAFATGTVLVVLPMISESCKKLLRERGLDSAEGMTTVDVLVPTAYSFPSAGTLLGLGFVLFAAWYVGTPLSLEQYPSYTLLGALTAFGSMAVAIPFMLDFFGLSADLFQLYLLGSVVTARFATAMAALHGVAVCLLGASLVMGRLRPRALLRVCAISVAGTAALMIGMRLLMTAAIPNVYTGEEAFVSMPLLAEPVSARQLERPTPLSADQLSRPRLEVIADRGRMRVGYPPDRLPFAYRSGSGEVVGFDLDLAHRLARDLGVGLELARVSWDDGVAALEDGGLDILVGGIAATPRQATRVAFTRSYLDMSLGFVIRDNRRNEFPNMASLAVPGLRVGVARSGYYQNRLREFLPAAEIVTVGSPRTFFRGEADIDLMGLAAEAGAAWTLVYPDYSVFVPRDLRVKGSTAFALPIGQADFFRYVDTWLTLAQKGGIVARLQRHWIEGRQEELREPRWSILTNVLGWGLDEEAHSP
ncbi:MAG: cation:dicarboxylase symporter family transporter [Deltaproteobacteria bacterium]|nr:cation:dicarboxylase symporter family transporter [Deltaproteobacteria bacterium]MBW2363293.1 cation:dicarboxylase symporter family transporter [Deltaproteobacteria bacterium]